jgi:hypothetical protein
MTMTSHPPVPRPALEAGTHRLVRLCTRHWFLRGWLDPLHRFAERHGYHALVRDNAVRLLEAAHIHRLRNDLDPGATRELATRALDGFERLAATGDADAAFEVAEAHRTGFGRPGNHWKALDAYARAADLGHSGAAERRALLAEREPIQDDAQERFARRALLKATYAQGQRPEWTTAGRDLRERWEGVGVRAGLVALGAAALIAGYILLDFTFFGTGHWRPDPARVAWGIIGKIHPPRSSDARRVWPAWLRPDVTSAQFSQDDYCNETGPPSRQFALGDLQGRVVLLHVVSEGGPLMQESIACFHDLEKRYAGQVEVVVVLLPGHSFSASIQAWVQILGDVRLCVPTDPRSLRPLGAMKVFPMTYVLDRRGRVRQRWVGFGAAITEEGVRAALAEA